MLFFADSHDLCPALVLYTMKRMTEDSGDKISLMCAKQSFTDVAVHSCGAASRNHIKSLC